MGIIAKLCPRYPIFVYLLFQALYHMNACWLDILSMNGLTSSLVAKLNISPNVMDMGKAGRAFLYIASNSRVRHRPCNMAKQFVNI